jgi:hypothetical protein
MSLWNVEEAVESSKKRKSRKLKIHATNGYDDACLYIIRSFPTKLKLAKGGAAREDVPERFQRYQKWAEEGRNGLDMRWVVLVGKIEGFDSQGPSQKVGKRGSAGQHQREVGHQYRMGWSLR